MVTIVWQLLQFPLCPFSRKVRVVCAEKAVPVELIAELPWQRSERLTRANPAGQTPVMIDAGAGPAQMGLTLVDSAAICDFFEETVERSPLLGQGAAERAETRRLVAWFDHKFYAEVTTPLLSERMYKRVFARQAPDATALRLAGRAAEGHLDYLDFLLDQRRWLSGPGFGLADIAAAAQLSVADYLAGIDWDGHEPARVWYMAMKSRPTFRPLLAERMEGLPPPVHYDKLDF